MSQCRLCIGAIVIQVHPLCLLFYPQIRFVRSTTRLII